MIRMHNTMDLKTLSNLVSERLAAIFASYLAAIPSLDLKEAMHYTLSNGGKHLRPQLIYATGAIFETSLENLDVPAAAVELIHSYSLIHDDLPSMDDADLRRGKASCHKVFGEGIAVLTGDSLHTLAMDIIANYPAALNNETRVAMMGTLSKACGPFGMVAGQALDITLANDKSITLDILENIYQLKTGALFSACIELGRIASLDDDEDNRIALQQFGNCIGLAFQIQDDILDFEATNSEFGKQQFIDVKNNKITYPMITGITGAKRKVEALYEEALSCINYLGPKAQLLRDLSQAMLNRNR